MDIYPIKTEQDYQRALADIESLMMAEMDTPEGDRLDILVTLVEDYEHKHYPIDFPDPVEAIKFVMDQRSLTIKDLVPMIGQANRVYEILNRKRALTLPMIKRLHRDLGIPAESLLSLN
jgi:HTH-type transcriptional regulator/antitoxin HigA